jgi:hypothetical protein
MAKPVKPASRFWAIANTGGWGEGYFIADAVKRAAKGGWAGRIKGKIGEGFEVTVYELDPAFPVTHISDENGHAIHRPADAVQTPMGRYEGERNPYAKYASGEWKMPKRFGYAKGAHSDAGANLDRLDSSFPEKEVA